MNVKLTPDWSPWTRRTCHFRLPVYVVYVRILANVHRFVDCKPCKSSLVYVMYAVYVQNIHTLYIIKKFLNSCTSRLKNMMTCSRARKRKKTTYTNVQTYTM